MKTKAESTDNKEVKKVAKKAPAKKTKLKAKEESVANDEVTDVEAEVIAEKKDCKKEY